MKIVVCVGSGCHVRGSRKIIDAIKELMDGEYKNINLELEGCFCQGHCNKGVVVKFNDELVTGVTPENVKEIVRQKIAEVN